jgi:Uma2 family endonuclease
MALREIVLPETEPETEWVRGRALQKMSPVRNHARLQSRLTGALEAWAEAQGRGEVGTEWRFRLAPPGEVRRPLVPDIAYVRSERLRGLAERDLQAPPLAPDAAVEILSPGDRPRDVRHKISVYLRAGCRLVIVVDPVRLAVGLHDAQTSRTLGEHEHIEHAVLPGFSYPIERLFAVLAPP